MRSGSPALGKLGTCSLVVVQKGRAIMPNPALRKKEVDRRPDVDAWKSGLVYLQTAGAPCGIPRLSNRTMSAKRTWERTFGYWLGGGHWQYTIRLKQSVCAASRVIMTRGHYVTMTRGHDERHEDCGSS